MNGKNIVKLLYHCSNTKSLPKTKKLHACILTSGILTSSQNPTHIISLLLSAYSKCDDLEYACKLFDKMPKRTSRSYRDMIRLHVEKGDPYCGLKLFVEMLQFGNRGPEKFVFPFVIRACGVLGLGDLGVCVHGLTVVSGFGFDRFVGNSLLAMYFKCGDKERARRVFGAMREKNTVACNTMISGYFRNGSDKEALAVFREMVDGGVEMDCATILSVLPVCGYLKNLKCGREVHLLVEEKGLGGKLAVWNSLVDMYVKCGEIYEARKIFDKMDNRDVVGWTTMINGYLLNDDFINAVNLCRSMQLEGVRPNEVTLASLLSVSANSPDLRLGKCMHGWALKQELESDVNVETALVDMYAKCKRVQQALRVFSRTSKKKTVPWNAIISGCVHNKLGREAIMIFKEMLLAAVKPNVATLKSLLPAYAVEPDLQQAISVHSFLIRSGFISKPEITTSILDVYAKCGFLEYAHRIFNEIPIKDRDIFMWSVIIAGCGMHGHGEAAVSLFREMVQTGVDPNEVTFTSVLHACSHVGAVDDGLSLFDIVQKRHPSCLRTDHYTCMVDLLGRAGRLEEAHELIGTMPFEPSPAVWGALLGACVIHENVELGEVATKWLFELEPKNTGNFVLMGKIYAALGRWGDLENIRRRIKKNGLIKTPAQSAIEMEKSEKELRESKLAEVTNKHFAASAIPKGIHCLSLRLTDEYSSNAHARRRLPSPELLPFLLDNSYHHFVLSTDNILAASVVVASTVQSSLEPGKIVFHVITDKKTYAGMHSWFSLNPVTPAIKLHLSCIERKTKHILCHLFYSFVGVVSNFACYICYVVCILILVLFPCDFVMK